mmetsp:Transcript_7914/g.12947  ORF Transcript_7914/g.12947 Transcript_7914/m.12947 type:complete len:205 (-) Transcript_7914:45-659(-)
MNHLVALLLLSLELELPLCFGSSDEQRTAIMHSCFQASTSRANKRAKAVQQMVQTAAKMGSMGQEDAVNAIILAWMVTCYGNMNEAKMTLLAKEGRKLSADLEDDIFGSRKYEKPLGKAFHEHMAMVLEGDEELLQLAKTVMAMPANGSRQDTGSKQFGHKGIIASAACLSIALFFIGLRFWRSAKRSGDASVESIGRKKKKAR